MNTITTARYLNGQDVVSSLILEPGTKIRFHGGYSSAIEKCPVCDWPCTYRYEGEIVGHYEVFDPRSRQSFPHPYLWEAKLETGSYAVGYAEQFEILDEHRKETPLGDPSSDKTE